MVRRRFTASTVDPDAETTECHECGATIDIEDGQTVTDAVVDHYQAAHGLGE